jgi:undecaprenyl-diphosphatase
MLLTAIVLGIVQGLTEFIPVSSTGHLILAGTLLDFTGDKANAFHTAIQTGSMFAVVGIFWGKLRHTVQTFGTREESRRFVLNVLVAFIPVILVGGLFGSLIQGALFNPPVVVTTLVLGGLIIIWAERRQTTVPPKILDVDQIRPKDALKIGLIQCIALIPGTSRAGATIIGGMLVGLSRKASTEFSFFLALPVLVAAGAYSLYKERALFHMADLPIFAVGFLFSFLAAWVCVRWLLRYVASHSFVPFAWYRIAFGVLVVITAWGGWVEWTD